MTKEPTEPALVLGEKIDTHAPDAENWLPTTNKFVERSSLDGKLRTNFPDPVDKQKFVRELEQKYFERWLYRVLPSGDAEEVNDKWFDSEDYQNFLFAKDLVMERGND